MSSNHSFLATLRWLRGRGEGTKNKGRVTWSSLRQGSQSGSGDSKKQTEFHVTLVSRAMEMHRNCTVTMVTGKCRALSGAEAGVVHALCCSHHPGPWISSPPCAAHHLHGFMPKPCLWPSDLRSQPHGVWNKRTVGFVSCQPALAPVCESACLGNGPKITRGNPGSRPQLRRVGEGPFVYVDWEPSAALGTWMKGFSHQVRQSLEDSACWV